MTDEVFVARLGKLYHEILKLRKDSNYTLNQPQMEKLVKVLDFFMKAAGELDGVVDKVDLIPREEHGGVTATFVVFDIYGEKVKEFCEAMIGCSAITIDATESGEVCISCTVPEVFVPLKK